MADIIKSAYIKAAKYKKKNPSHNAMLASDLEEAMNLKENIKTNPRQLYEKRNECEQEFEQAKKLLIAY
ncbi:hypothetical protein [Vaccinium witches'-broom phytoplasma]|uniref:hypothetical protein n=1 Tax=Vaccinium witches'-broom phytoplasma TaxID=85642 RepID=UPI0012677E3E|nr:hypothetical protein [Vaccinium witches'-broom phytoplasma]